MLDASKQGSTQLMPFAIDLEGIPTPIFTNALSERTVRHETVEENIERRRALVSVAQDHFGGSKENVGALTPTGIDGTDK